jgi:hypothetical protein
MYVQPWVQSTLPRKAPNEPITIVSNQNVRDQVLMKDACLSWFQQYQGQGQV